MRPYRLIFYFFKCYLDGVQYRIANSCGRSFLFYTTFLTLSDNPLKMLKIRLIMWTEIDN